MARPGDNDGWWIAGWTSLFVAVLVGICALCVRCINADYAEMEAKCRAKGMSLICYGDSYRSCKCERED
jgi:hypothetical protein